MENYTYPVWRFHKTKLPDGKIVYSEAEDEALGPGWVDSPAKFDVEEEKSDEPAVDTEPSVELPVNPIEEPSAPEKVVFTEDELRKKSKVELESILLGMGLDDKGLHGMKKFDLIEMILERQ